MKVAVVARSVPPHTDPPAVALTVHALHVSYYTGDHPQSPIGLLSRRDRDQLPALLSAYHL